MIVKLVACFLAIIFSQKAGAGLFIHDWLHTSEINDKTDKSETRGDVNYSCTCADDFLMPFVATEEFIVPASYVEKTIPAFYFKEEYFFIPPACLFLRGPPASV